MHSGLASIKTGLPVLMVMALVACGGGGGSEIATAPVKPDAPIGSNKPSVPVTPTTPVEPVAPATFTIGGTVAGLYEGNQVTLQNNAGDTLTVNAKGNFTFAKPVASGAGYAVTVSTQPVGQVCTLTGASGSVGSAAVADVTVACTNPITVSYEFLERWDIDTLNSISKNFTLGSEYTHALNAVNLYRVTYSSVIPELGNKPTTASGLLVIPETQSATLPMLSYQHGISINLNLNEAPSTPKSSFESLLMITEFAGQGYILVSADYFGLGSSTEPRSFMVKASQQQASYDMIMASRGVLDDMKLSANKLFIAGWSEGGFATMSLLQKLQTAGVKVDATATAAAPLDALGLVNSIVSAPQGNNQIGKLMTVFSAFSFEHYYGATDLARSIFTDEYYDGVKAIYERTQNASVPNDPHKLIRPEYFDEQYLKDSAFGKLLESNEAYKWQYQSEVRNYYGEADTLLPVDSARAAMTYAEAHGNSMVKAISIGAFEHVGTFARAMPEWKIWFDSLSH